jgi:hypothetical protein
MKQLQKKNTGSTQEVSRHYGTSLERKSAGSSHPLQRTLGNQAVQHLLRSGFLQPPPVIRAVIPPETIAGEWIIDDPTHRHTPATGRTDAEILGQAFNDICDLTSRNNDRIVMNAGPPASNRMEGCGCLQTIEQDLSSPSPVLSGMPHVRLEEAGWSRTNPAATPPYVAARHPESEFAWGYWTAGQTRHVKPFWQTVAHEICGHVAAYVKSSGGSSGARGVGTGHNVAIEGENRVASEHGVSQAELRGMDYDAATGRPLAGHRGESFLQAAVTNFGHGSDALPAGATAVVNDTVSTIRTARTSSMATELMVQVEGRAYTNEGGLTLARSRADRMHTHLGGVFRGQRFPERFQASTGATVSRFSPDQAAVEPGQSVAGQTDLLRRVLIYLFHQPHSAGP